MWNFITRRPNGGAGGAVSARIQQHHNQFYGHTYIQEFMQVVVEEEELD
jgi:hypothetical protein